MTAEGPRLALLAALLAGCYRPIRVFDVEKSVLEGRYDSFLKSGAMELELASGGRCEGRFEAGERSRPRNWGRVFDGGIEQLRHPILADADRYGSSRLECPNGLIFECEFVANPNGGEGMCHDSRWRWYRLLLD